MSECIISEINTGYFCLSQTQTEEAQQQCLDVSFLDISGLSTEEQQNLFKILKVPVPEEERFPLSDHGNECVEHCPNRPPENYSPVQVRLKDMSISIC